MGQSNAEQDERLIRTCGCHVDLRNGRLLGYNRVCSAAGALFAELRAAPGEAQEEAVNERLRRHATT